jgi:hypothetical protein
MYSLLYSVDMRLWIQFNDVFACDCFLFYQIVADTNGASVFGFHLFNCVFDQRDFKVVLLRCSLDASLGQK